MSPKLFVSACLRSGVRSGDCSRPSDLLLFSFSILLSAFGLSNRYCRLRLALRLLRSADLAFGPSWPLCDWLLPLLFVEALYAIQPASCASPRCASCRASGAAD